MMSITVPVKVTKQRMPHTTLQLTLTLTENAAYNTKKINGETSFNINNIE